MKHDLPTTSSEVDADDDLVEVDEYEDYQYEFSTQAASQFLDDYILPHLEEFDYSNSHEDYVPGVAGFGLYMKLVSRLLDAGFTATELKNIVDEYDGELITDTVH
jgi:hypothetical protein